MTIATLDQSTVDHTPGSTPEPPIPASAGTRLFTIAEISEIADQVGLSGAAIADEIRAINPKPFRWHDEELYELTVMDRAIQTFSADAMNRARSIASQGVAVVTPPAQKPPVANRTAAKKTSARKPAAKKTVAAT